MALCLARPDPARASAWNRGAGQGFGQIDVTLDAGDRYFDAAGRLAPARRYRSAEGAGYIEYGGTDWLMVIARPSLDATRVGPPGGDTFLGPGATAAGAQVQVGVFGPAVLAVQSSFRIPGTASRGDPATIGDTAREGDFRLLGGVGFHVGPLPAFLDAQAAYRLRSGGGAPEWHADLTAGVKVTPDLQVLLQSFSQISRGPGTPDLPGSDYSKLRLSLVRRITPAVAIQVGVFATVAGRNALFDRGLVLAVWYEF